jgi:predicted AlkP superfamily pyrophosphatase or phosphodiesterase
MPGAMSAYFYIKPVSMFRIILFCFFAFVLHLPNSYGQNTNTGTARPKLVVGIVVDQMRWDYLERFQQRFNDSGFNRMMREGFSADNTLIPYTPTYTAAGHASIYTGSVPAMNGIIGNNWFSRETGEDMYCVEDQFVTTVGSGSYAGQMSPKNLWATTISDELRLSTNFRSKVIGIALKDRGAILPAGHSANGAYWFDNSTGGWVTSSFYMRELPKWLQQFNSKRIAGELMDKDWNTLYPIETYTQSTADDKTFEGPVPGDKNRFPHELSKVRNDKFNSFRYTPMANDFTIQTAMAAVEGEGLGQDEFTDLLAVSFSSPDYIGHAFGPNSIEVEDTYLRLDRELGKFFGFLDQKVGKGNYLVFLSADHGAAHVPQFLRENRIPAGIVEDAVIKRSLTDSVRVKFGINDAVLHVMNYQVYLNYATVGTQQEEVTKYLVKKLAAIPQISQAFSLTDPSQLPLPEKIAKRVINGYNQKLSGDIQFVFRPQFFDGGLKGTTHGSWNPYDAHIPNVWFGWNVKHGRSSREVYMTDIAATLAAMLKIQVPSACIGEPIPELVP